MSNEIGQTKLKERNIGLITMVLMIYSICASGAYGVESMVPSLGPGLAIVFLIVFPFIWGLPQALVSAELGSAMPVQGGYYRWTQRALGEFWGFQTLYWRLLGQFVGLSAYIVLAAGYIVTLVPMTETQLYIVKVAFVILFAIVNLIGVKEASLVSSIISIFVILAFAAITVLGFMNWHTDPFAPFMVEGQSLFMTLGSGIAIAMWMYSGFESITTIGGEVKDKMVIPKAVLIVLPLIAISYILPLMAGLASVGQWESWGASGINFATMAELSGSSLFILIFALIAVIANLSIFNSSLVYVSRGPFVLAEDGMAPKFFERLNKKGVPHWGVLLVVLVSFILIQFSFETIVVIQVTCLMASYFVVWIAGIALRIKEPDLKRPFKVPGGTVAQVFIYAPGMIIVILALMLNGTDYFLGGMIGIASGPIVYVIFRNIFGGLGRINPAANPVNPKTKLAYGDLKRMSLLFALFTVLGIMASFALPVYEGSWGPEYYDSIYGTTGLFDKMLIWIKMVSGSFAGIALILMALSAKLEKKIS